MNPLRIEKIRSKGDLAEFVTELRNDLVANREGWENNDLAAYLGALAAWIDDMDGFYQSNNEPVPQKPEWKHFAEMLAAARSYE